MAQSDSSVLAWRVAKLVFVITLICFGVPFVLFTGFALDEPVLYLVIATLLTVIATAAMYQLYVKERVVRS